MDAKAVHDKLKSGEYTISANKQGKSEVWRNFGYVNDENGRRTNFVACKACKQPYSHCRGNGTSIMKNHKCRSPTAATGATNNLFGPRPTTSSCSMDDKAKVTAAAAQWIASDLRPFNTIQGKGHLQYIQTVSYVIVTVHFLIILQSLETFLHLLVVLFIKHYLSC